MKARQGFISLLILLAVIAVTLPPRTAHADSAVAEPFRDYYARHAGMRVLGPPITGLVIVGGYAAQYFEKGRIEDHRAEEADSAWGLMYGRLTAELIERDPSWFVNGTDITYATLREAAAPEHRHAPPAGLAAALQSCRMRLTRPRWPGKVSLCPTMHNCVPPLAITCLEASGRISRGATTFPAVGCTTSACP
jgi:hypothetical protein